MGKLMDFLDNQKLAANTILIFLTDNGSTYGHRYYPAGMRGHKTQLYEGGHRVPLFVRWSGGNLGKPRDVDGLTKVKDVMPTLVDLCGLVYPQPLKFDGMSLAPVLKGNAKVPEDRMLVINYSRMPFNFDYPSPESPSIIRRDGALVMWKRWRLLNDSVLYDLNADPMQEKNIIKSRPDIATIMKNRLDTWWDEVADIANKSQPVVIGNDRENPVMLTACEWMDVFVDQQEQVRQGVQRNSFWNVYVDNAGEYEFILRPLPKEADTIPVKSGYETVVLPIASARMAIDDQLLNQRVPPKVQSATFTVRLNKGPAVLHTWFLDKNNRALCGAYYVYVRRIG
jgi:hypothetical protein